MSIVWFFNPANENTGLEDCIAEAHAAAKEIDEPVAVLNNLGRWGTFPYDVLDVAYEDWITHVVCPDGEVIGFK